MTVAGATRPRRNQVRQEPANRDKDDGLNGAHSSAEAGRSDNSIVSSEEEEETSESGEEDDQEDDEDGEEDEDDDEAEAEDGEDDEDESPFRFLEQLDSNWLIRKSQGSISLSAPSASQGANDSRSPAAGADDTEFYGAMIQMLTHVLGSSDSVTWPNQHTPASQLAPSPFGPSYSSPAQTSSHANFALAASSRSPAGGGSERSKSELSALQPMIQALIARLGKDHQLPRRPVGEQDLTALLQTLMEQQQRQQEQQRTQREGSSNQAVGSYSASNYALGQQYPMAQVTSSRASKKPGQTQSTFAPVQSIAYQPLNFADLDFEDEDEDDPDFNPDLNPDLPLPSAWSLAVRDVVASEESRAAAAAAAAVASHSGTPSGNQTPATNGLLNDTYRASNPQPSDRSPMHTPRGTDTCRASLGEQTVQSSGRESLGGISNSDHASSAAPGRTVQADDRWSSSRHVVPQAPSFSTAREDTSSTLLLSPSGRPVRSSRKRQSSPISAPQARDARGGRREDTHQLLTGSQGFRDEGEYTGQSAHRATLNTARAGLSPSMRERSSTCFDATSASVPPQSQSQSQSGDTESSAPRKRGRKPVLEPGEAQRRRAQRNIEYQRMRRQAKKAEESEQGETVLELKAEVKMLRAEMERLRDENAMLRAQRELERLQRSDS